jgi:hypothetical protein
VGVSKLHRPPPPPSGLFLNKPDEGCLLALTLAHLCFAAPRLAKGAAAARRTRQICRVSCFLNPSRRPVPGFVGCPVPVLVEGCLFPLSIYPLVGRRVDGLGLGGLVRHS